MPHPFDRYAAFTDVKALKDVSARPLKKSIRVNLLKSSTEEFRQWALAHDWQLEPIPWCPEGFFVERIDREEALGKDVLHILGHTYLQEAASMLPVTLLDPKPGETILDMSAAPGSKTTQIASQMSSPVGQKRFCPTGQQQGMIIANDVQEKRLWSLLSNLKRSGVVNVIVTKKVGQWFARNMTERFDRVLCDAPCTAQGTVRKDTTALQYTSDDNIGKMARLQRELLESAVHACKVGGRIVYSTCTLTPEENEQVVRSIMNKFSTQLKVLDPLQLSALSFELSSLEKAQEDSLVVQQWPPARNNSTATNNKLQTTNSPFLRLWPQTFDTEGFFCAVIEKRASTISSKRQTERVRQRFDRVPRARQAEIAGHLNDWYGTSFLREHDVLLSSKENLFLTAEHVASFELPAPWYAIGLPFGKCITGDSNRRLTVRVSHELATLRGHEANEQMVSIDEQQLRALLRGENLKRIQTEAEPGDVLLTFSGASNRRLTIGRGLFKEGDILNRLPREVVRMFG